MPAAIGIPAIVGLGFALVAIAMVELVRTLVVSPMRGATPAIGAVPGIGGTLAWLVRHVADMIDVGLAAQAYIVEQAKGQALWWWNYMVQNTVDNLPLLHWAQVAMNTTNIQAVTALAQFMWYNTLPALAGRVQTVERNDAATTALAQAIWYNDLPAMRGIDQLLRHDLDAVTRLAQDLFYRELPRIAGIEAGIRTDLNAVTKLAQDIWYDALPRIRTDVGARALQSDVDALKNTIAQQQAILGALAALMPLAIAGAESIANLRCMMDTPCANLNALTDTDLESRVSLLEMGEQ